MITSRIAQLGSQLPAFAFGLGGIPQKSKGKKWADRGRQGGVCERVSIVMVQLPIPKDFTRERSATTARNSRAAEAIMLCAIPVVDTSGYHRRCAGRCRCWGGRATTARATAVDVKHVVHVAETNALHRQRIRIPAIWCTDVARSGLGIRIRTDDEEVGTCCVIR